MKARSIVLTLTLCFISALCLGADSQMGTWKLNESKSKLNPGMGKNHTVIYAAEGDSVKITVDGVDSEGKATHSEWTGKFDEKDYPVTGDPNSDTRSYKVVDDHTLAMTVKKGDKVTVEGSIVVSADGKTRTITLNGTDSKGNPFSSTGVYDKQ